MQDDIWKGPGAGQLAPAWRGNVTPDMAAAMAAAQSEARALYKEGKADKYPYTTAEQLIDEGRRALNAHGLSLVELGNRVQLAAREVVVDGARGKRTVIVHSVEVDYLLSGPGGGWTAWTRAWPAVEDVGRPADKAVAAALTSALGYTYRGVLGIPRDDNLAMDQRNDEDYSPGGQSVEPRAERPPVNDPDADRVMTAIGQAMNAPAALPAGGLDTWLAAIRTKPREGFPGALAASDLGQDEKRALTLVFQAYGASDRAAFVATAADLRRELDRNEPLKTWALEAIRPAFECLQAPQVQP